MTFTWAQFALLMAVYLVGLALGWLARSEAHNESKEEAVTNG